MEVGVPCGYRHDCVRYVYSIPFVFTFVPASLVSRYRNKGKKEDEEYLANGKIKSDRSARMHSAMERLDFVTRSPEQQKKISQDYESE